MKLFKTVTTVCCAAVIGAICMTGAKADEWNRKTVITFSGPVEIPGVHLAGWGVLPAGSYVFKILDTRSDRHIVQIFSKDELTIYATILAIPNDRLKPTGKTVMTFRKDPQASPKPSAPGSIRAEFGARNSCTQGEGNRFGKGYQHARAVHSGGNCSRSRRAGQVG